MKGQRQGHLRIDNSVLNDITKDDGRINTFIKDPSSKALDNTGDCVNQVRADQSKECNNIASEKFEIDMSEAMGQKEVSEPLDLRVARKDKEIMEKYKCILDPANELSLIMEVDEIEDHTQREEVEQDEDNNLANNWNCSVSGVAMSPTCESALSPDHPLLIDDDGIPYTLTLNGEKVPQIDPSEEPITDLEQMDHRPSQFDGDVDADTDVKADVDGEVSVAKQYEDAQQEGFASELQWRNSRTRIKIEKTSEDSTVKTLPTALSAMSKLSSLPIKILSSHTESNTPILLLPPAHLQSLQSSVEKRASSGIFSLSFPLALAQNTKSSPVLLVLSPQASGGMSSDPVSQTSAASLACEAKADSVSATMTNLSGKSQTKSISSSPTSPMPASPSNSPNRAKLQKTDSCSDMPTSFREALLRLAASAEQKNETQPKCTDQPLGFTPFSETSDEPCNTKQKLEVSKQASTSVEQTVALLSPDSNNQLLPLTSPVRPDSPILPSNGPKNPDSQGLDARRILYCQYCPRVFYYLSDLERHSITHSQKKPHVCQVCGKAFKRSSHLERHKHIHTGERNFECQLCPRRFREAAELTRHQRVHTGEKPYQCVLCHMRFAERNTLRRHTKRKHQGQQQEAMKGRGKQKAEGLFLAEMPGQEEEDEEEENAEWYSSTLTEIDSCNDTGGE